MYLHEESENLYSEQKKDSQENREKEIDIYNIFT